MGMFDDALSNIQAAATSAAQTYANSQIDKVLSANGVVTAPATSQATQAAATNNVVKADSISVVAIAVIGIATYFLFKKSRV